MIDFCFETMQKQHCKLEIILTTCQPDYKNSWVSFEKKKLTISHEDVMKENVRQIIANNIILEEVLKDAIENDMYYDEYSMYVDMYMGEYYMDMAYHTVIIPGIFDSGCIEQIVPDEEWIDSVLEKFECIDDMKVKLEEIHAWLY